jgi:hypothetical protein
MAGFFLGENTNIFKAGFHDSVFAALFPQAFYVVC